MKGKIYIGISLLYFLGSFFMASCQSSYEDEKSEQEAYTTQYDSLFELHQGTTEWIPSEQYVLFGNLGISEAEVPREEVLSLMVNFNRKDKINLDSLYQFENIIALRFFIRLEYEMNDEGKWVKYKDLELAKLFNQFDLSKFKRLRNISFGFDKELMEDVDQLLATAKYVKYVNIIPTSNDRIIPNAICDFEEVRILNIHHSSEHGKLLPIAYFPEKLKHANIKKVRLYSKKMLGKLRAQKNKDVYFEWLERVRWLDRNKDNINYQPGSARYVRYQNDAFAKHKRFMQSIFTIKSLEEVDLYFANIDSIPPEVGTLKKLKKVQLYNCMLSYIPKEFRKLNQLEELRIHMNSEIGCVRDTSMLRFRQEAEEKGFHNASLYYHFQKGRYDKPGFRFEYIFPDLEMAGTGGLKGLKHLTFYNVPMKSFPDLSESLQLQRLTYHGDPRTDSIPSYIGASHQMDMLIWRGTSIRYLPDHLNQCPLRIFQVDDNRLKSIENVLDAAANATYFSYDINDVPYSKRKLYNETITQKKGSPYPEIDTPEQQALYDRLIHFGYNPIDDLADREGIEPFGKDYPYDWSYAVGQYLVSKKFGGERILITQELVNEFMEWAKLADSLEVSRKNLPDAFVDAGSKWFYVRFQQYPDEMAYYDSAVSIFYTGERHIFPSFYMKADRFPESDVGHMKHVRKIKLFKGRYAQELFNMAVRSKGLGSLIVKMKITSIPECFCELTSLKEFVLEGKQIHANELKILDEKGIQYPDCMKSMKF